MAALLRPVGYTGSLQQLTWTGAQSTVQAYLWGGGGGGGGDEGTDDPGGNGGGGAFAQNNFVVNPGDVITVAVGQGGSGGTRTPGTVVGAGGRSLAYSVFDTRSQSNVVPVTNAAWSTFMNAHAVWDAGGPGTTPIFRSYNVNFPVTGYYVFQYSVDNTMSVDFDGTNIISYSGFTSSPPPLVTRLVTAGNHTINITASNSGGPAGVALTVNISFSGGNGGDGSGGSNGGGSGGGGGGATVVLLNNTVIAVAGGGAGGGGAGGNGNTPGTSGPDAPGPWGYPTSFVTLAQNGQGSSIGGGGGGGGGGQNAGNGGRRGGASPSNPSGAADRNATAGSFGESLGTDTANPSGRFAGARTNEYYTKSSIGGYGGTKGTWLQPNGQNGINGAAAFVLDINSEMYIFDENLWKPITNIYVRHNDRWQEPKAVYIKNAGLWKQVFSTDPPVFTSVSGGFGQISRDPN